MDYVGWNLKVITENVLYKTFLESITIKGGKKVSISRRMLVGIIVVVIAIIVVVAFVAVSPVTRPQLRSQRLIRRMWPLRMHHV